MIKLIFNDWIFTQKEFDLNELVRQISLDMQEIILYITIFTLEREKLKNHASVGVITDVNYTLLNLAELAINQLNNQLENLLNSHRVSHCEDKLLTKLENRIENPINDWLERTKAPNQVISQLAAEQQRELFYIILFIAQQQKLKVKAMTQLSNEDKRILEKAKSALKAYNDLLKDIKQINDQENIY